jgi:hypothetical protein
MRTFIYILLCLSLLSADLQASRWGEELEKPSRWYYGANFGVNFIDKGIFSFCQGNLAYRINSRTYIGISPAVNFYAQKMNYYHPIKTRIESELYTSTYLEASLFLRKFISRRVFLQVDPGIAQYKSLENFYYDINLDQPVFMTEKIVSPFGLAGIGYIAPLGEHSYIIFRAQYDVLGLEQSPYKGWPVIRGGIGMSN